MQIEIVLSPDECVALESLAEGLGETMERASRAVLAEWLLQQGYLAAEQPTSDNVAPCA